MKISRFTSASVAAIAAASVSTSVVYAQQTTSQIRGVVTDATGAPVTDARVTITDSRTGASRTSGVSDNGQYSTRNLTPGGPYSISVSANGYRGETIEGVFISVSSASVVSFDLEAVSAGGASDEIVVVASRTNTQQLAIGPSSSFGLETIEALPSISRDIRDIIRIDPRLTVQGGDDAVSCLGGNNRFNSFTIDGVQSNDAFGLNASGLPSRANFPIPFDGIRETAVEFAPYDVTYGQFTGCNVNIVTKGGTNEFHGSAFAVFNSRSLTGSTIEGDSVLSDSPFRDYNWGASLGGPVIKDKLFFFVTYEEIDDGGSIINGGPEGLGFANPVEGFSAEEANQLSDILSSVYGLDNGGIPSVVPETSRRILTRWDYLITDNHRLEFTYAREREAEVEPDLQDAEFQFLNSFETSGSSNEFYSARLFSQWTDNFSTELRASRRDNQDIQNPVGGGEAQDANPIPRLLVGVGTVDGDPVQVSGPGIFRSANELVTQTDQIRAKFDYVFGSHTFTGGYELNQLDVFNLFAVDATGSFVFDSIDDFAAGTASSIEANGSFSGDINDAAASFSRSIHSLYFQDEWQPTDALSVVLGLRYDFYSSSDAPTESQAFVDRYGFSNSVGFDNLDVFLPRLGINYDAGDTFFGTTQFRAGAGVFAGGDPTVIFSNAFSNFGGALGGGDSDSGTCGAADLQVLQGGAFTGIPQCILDQQQAEAAAGQGRTDAIDPNFKIQSLVRGSFGFTHITDFRGAAGGFFDDWKVDVDVIYSRRRNAPDFVDLTLSPNGTILPDGRPQFNAIDPLLAGCDAVFLGPRLGFAGADLSEGGVCDAGFDDQDILLTNVDGANGGSLGVSAIFGKRFEYSSPWGKEASANFNFGYAYTRARDVNPNTSSTATSNFEEVAVAVLNNPVLAPSQFENRHNISFSAIFNQDVIGELNTGLAFFVSAREGEPFSYAYDNNTPTSLFGDSDNEERNLFYVPTGVNDPLVDLSGLADQAAFFAFLDDSGLNEFAGQIVPRGAFRDPWFVDVDFRFSQDLPTFADFLRAQFYVDIENVLNLIDDSRNVLREFDRGDVGEAVPVLDAGLSADGSQFVYTGFPTSEISGTGGFDRDLNPSLWSVQFGLRFEF